MNPAGTIGRLLVTRGLRRPDLRVYFYLLPVYLGAMVWLVHALPPDTTAHLLALALVYYSLCCTFIPLPTTGVMVWLNVMGLDPLTVATVAAAGTTLANLFDYHIITFFMGYPFVERVRRTRLYVVAVRWFDRHPLLTIVLWNMIPFSLDIARWIASMRGYSRPRFMLGSFLGRWPRYVGIGLITHLLGFTETVAMILILVAAVGGVTRAAAYFWHFWRQRRTLNDQPRPPEQEGTAGHETALARVDG